MPADVLPGYTWNPASQRYRSSATGRYVSRREILRLLEEQTNQGDSLLGALTAAAFEGAIALAVWTDQMQSELRRLHSQNRALAAGGWDRMTPRDWGAVGGRLRDDYARVQRLATEIRNDTVSLPQALNRVNGYVGNARVQFWNAERERRHPEPGQAFISKRNLGAAEHCGDCVDYYDRGWCVEGQLPSPGVESECMSHCRCTLEYRQVPVAELDDWLGTRRR